MTNVVTIHFDGNVPTESEVMDYIRDNYSFTGELCIDICPEHLSKGGMNPGVVIVEGCFF